MRYLGIFNLVYGLLGLISSLVLLYLLPGSNISRPVLVTGGLASAWILTTGIVLMIWGDLVMRKIRSKASSIIGRFTRPPAPIQEPIATIIEEPAV